MWNYSFFCSWPRRGAQTAHGLWLRMWLSSLIDHSQWQEDTGAMHFYEVSRDRFAFRIIKAHTFDNFLLSTDGHGAIAHTVSPVNLHRLSQTKPSACCGQISSPLFLWYPRDSWRHQSSRQRPIFYPPLSETGFHVHLKERSKGGIQITYSDDVLIRLLWLLRTWKPSLARGVV